MKKFIRKLLVLLIVIVLSLTVVGCKPNAKNNDSSTDKQNPTINGETPQIMDEEPEPKPEEKEEKPGTILR